jgi:hypothetical protein
MKVGTDATLHADEAVVFSAQACNGVGKRIAPAVGGVPPEGRSA